MEKEIKVTKIFKKNFEAKTTIVLNEGGARSSKSYSIAQLLIYKVRKEKGKKFLITRKTLPALKITSYKLFIDLLIEYKMYYPEFHNKTMRTYELNENFILFTSIDDPTKLQSTEFNYIWMEEAEEFTFEDFLILQTRLSGKTEKSEKNQIFLTYNPKQEQSWINKKVRGFKDVTIIKSSYKDNPYISKEYKKILEGLKKQNEKYYKVFALGEYSEIEGKIYTNIKKDEDYPKEYEELIFGLDFGYNNPTCLLQIGIKEKIYYVEEKIYKTNITNHELIEELKILKIPGRYKIYADASEPNRIEEIKRAGYQIYAAEKNVNSGIDFIKRCDIRTNEKNINFNKESENYVYAKDKNGNLTEEPVKYLNHAMDALRYALWTHRGNKKEIRIRWI